MGQASIYDARKAKALVRKWAEQVNLPHLENGICCLFTYPDFIDRDDWGPWHCDGYSLMSELLPPDLYKRHGCGTPGVWTDHRLNILCLIDNLTDAEWLELFTNATFINSTVNDSKGPTAGQAC